MLYKRLLDEKKYLEEKYLIKIIKLNNICDADLDLSSYYKEINEKFGVISTEKKEMHQQMNIFEIKQKKRIENQKKVIKIIYVLY